MRKNFKKMLGLTLSALMVGTAALPGASYVVHAESVSAETGNTDNPDSGSSNGNETSIDESAGTGDVKPGNDNNEVDSGSDNKTDTGNNGNESGTDPDSGSGEDSEECTNHALKKVYGTPASCTAEGTKTHYVCDICGKLFLDADGENEVSEEDIKIPEAHEWNTPTYDWSGAEVTGDSTELSSEPNGYTVTAKTTCKLCGKELSETEEFSTDSDHVADCTKEPVVKHYTTDFVNSAFANNSVTYNTGETNEGHNFTEFSNQIATPATCTEKAQYYLKCSDCDVVSTDETDEKEDDEPLGHSFTDKPSNVQAAAGTCGSNTYYVQCDRCDAVSDTKTVVVGDATDHLNTIVINQKDATCTEPGYTGDTVCDQCGALIEEGKEIPATGHKTSDKVSDQIAEKATCTTPAKYYLLCDTCGEVTEDTKEVGKPNGHSFTNKDSGKVKEEATCTSPATHYVQCDNCDEVSADKTIEVGSTDADNHGNIVLKNDKKATCKEAGYTGDEYCDDCGKLVKAGTEIPMTKEHTWDAGKVTKAATCTQTGEKTYTCSICGETKKETIAKTDHNWVPKTETKTSGTDVVTTTKKTFEQCSVCKEIRNVKTASSIRIKSPSATLKAGKKAFNVKIKKLSGVNGYQIKYSVKKNMKKAKTVTTKKVSNKVKKLGAKKKYYVQVRAYKTVNGKKIFSSWSKVKSIKTKK